MKIFEFDTANLQPKAFRMSFARFCFKAFKWIVFSAATACAYYFLFALVYDSGPEKALKAENAFLEKNYDSLSRRVEMVSDEVRYLEARDRQIYKDLFNTSLPGNVMALVSSSSLGSEDILDLNENDLHQRSYEILGKAETAAAGVSSMLDSISSALDRKKDLRRRIPSKVPVRPFAIGQTGASIGNKYNPFYKTLLNHDGIDLIVPTGTEVVAAADGVVSRTKHLDRILGNVITITHDGGIQTEYSHLGDISVTSGQRIAKGALIGHSGSTGRSFAPHLHYEVRLSGKSVEPVHYFFSDLGCVASAEMLLLAETAGQTME